MKVSLLRKNPSASFKIDVIVIVPGILILIGNVELLYGSQNLSVYVHQILGV